MSAEPQVVGLDRLDAFGIGHAQDEAGGTGISVVICEKGAVAGLEVRGGSPGTREAEGLDPAGSRSSIHAVFLAGGSAFGLDAAAGVVRGLRRRVSAGTSASAECPSSAALSSSTLLRRLPRPSGCGDGLRGHDPRPRA